MKPAAEPRALQRPSPQHHAPRDQLLGGLGAQLHLGHLLRRQVNGVLDVQVCSENGFTGITLLLIFPRFQRAFEGLFINQYYNKWLGELPQAQIM